MKANYITVTEKNLPIIIKKIKDPLTKGVTIVNTKKEEVLSAIGYELLNKETREIASSKLKTAVLTPGVGELLCKFA